MWVWPAHGESMLSSAQTPLLPRLSDRAASASSSAIRDLLDQAKRPGMISVAGGLPDASLFPTAELAAISQRVITDQGARVLQYGVTSGDETTRSAMTRLFTPGTEATRLVVTTGSQQALDLIARTVVNPGDQVVAGDPDYLGALQVFRSYGTDVRSVPVDSDGLDTGHLEDELRWGLRPKCCYIVPNFHNPTGVTMSAERRMHLNELAQRYGFLVIEDDPYRDLYFGGAAPEQIESDPQLTVQLRSTSKILAPGLRIGALAGPQWLTDAVTTAKQSVDLHTSTLTQAIVAEALIAPWFDDHLATLRRSYEAKRDVLIDALGAAFDGEIEIAVPAGGMFLWARFHGIDDATDWLQRCLDNGVCFVPGQAFSVHRDLSQHARLSFATGSVDELTVAVERLAASMG